MSVSACLISDNGSYPGGAVEKIGEVVRGGESIVDGGGSDDSVAGAGGEVPPGGSFRFEDPNLPFHQLCSCSA